MTFANLPPFLGSALAERGYSAPTQVQAAVLEEVATGRDLLVSAQTGSGKTVAFGLAMAGELLDQSGVVVAGKAPHALVIAPTRELALQVSRELAWLYGKANGRIATCVGGMNPSVERRALQSGANIVVGTPGRLRDHLERGALDLSALAAVVIDEADEMLDMGFREELEEILDAAPAGRRTLLFSATIPRPIEAMARRYQRDALRISTIGEQRGHGDIAYQAVTVSPSKIENAVINLLRYHEAETAILFCATRDNVRHLYATLRERGFAVVALSGEHSQQERNHALQALRDRRARVCVATDVAARGIDLPTLSLVIHVEIPRDAEVLQHRSGRTGRAGKKGTAILLVPYPRRKRAEGLLRQAKVTASWIEAPGRDAIRARDQERLLETLMQPAEFDETDRELAECLLSERSPQDIAAMLVRTHRAALPEPEELIDDSSEARRTARQEHHRPGFEDTVWFRMNVGRRQNADPRWILPLLCRRGHVTRGEIGAIRIMPAETRFEVPRAIAARFAAALTRTVDSGDDEGAIVIEPSECTPRKAARQNRKQAGQGARMGNPPSPSPGRKVKQHPSMPHSNGSTNEPSRSGGGRPSKPWKKKVKAPSKTPASRPSRGAGADR